LPPNTTLNSSNNNPGVAGVETFGSASDNKHTHTHIHKYNAKESSR
jgi:hypothetical protein